MSRWHVRLSGWVTDKTPNYWFLEQCPRLPDSEVDIDSTGQIKVEMTLSSHNGMVPPLQDALDRVRIWPVQWSGAELARASDRSS